MMAACTDGGHRLNGDGKVDLRVLYVGGQSDFETMGGTRHSAEEIETSVAARMDSFEEFLKSKFTAVEVIRGENYSPDMSNAFDVTIFDGRPPVIEPRRQGYDSKGNSAYRVARLLP